MSSEIEPETPEIAKPAAPESPDSPPFLSPQKLAANRANALRSTGPRTPGGKSRSAANALIHGLRARLDPAALVANTERHDYTDFLDHLRQTLDPLNPLEDLLVERIALLAWKLRRNAMAQAHLLDLTNQRERQKIELQNKAALDKHHEQLDWHKRYRTRESPPPPILQPIPDSTPAAHLITRFAESGGAPLDTLLRYETATERAFYKALHQYRLLHLDPADAETPNELHHHFHYHHHEATTETATAATVVTAETLSSPPPPLLECAKFPNEPTDLCQTDTEAASATDP
jgi:hypothetical protein